MARAVEKVADITDLVVAVFDGGVDVTMKIKVSVKGYPKVPCMGRWSERVAKDLNRKF